MTTVQPQAAAFEDLAAKTRATSPVPPRRQILRAPLPLEPRWKTRLVIRSVMASFGHRVLAVEGLERLAPECDPFIMVLNHTTRLEAVLLPSLFAVKRRGKLIPFVADWNFALIPGIATILRAGDCILLVRKPARPAWLNVFKPLFERKGPAFERARDMLAAGRSVGIFPEGTANRHPTQLLRGFDGAARLSLVSGKPVLPVGVRFPGQSLEQPIPERAPMEVRIGESLTPPAMEREPSRQEVRDWHAVIMGEVGRLCGKRWEQSSRRKKHAFE